MIDFNNLPKPQLGNVDYFWGKSAVDGQVWETWEKPRGARMIHILTIGGGGGGGGGASNPASVGQRSGGAGGCSSSVAFVTLPAFALPDILYVSSGSGGLGGSPGNPAGLGGRGIGSYVSILPFGSIPITLTSATTTATATSIDPHGLSTGDLIVVSGATPGQYNGTYFIVVTSTTQFTYTITSTTPTASSPGTGSIFATKVSTGTILCYALGGNSSAVQAASTVTSPAPTINTVSSIQFTPLAGLGTFTSYAPNANAGAGGSFSNGVGGIVLASATPTLLTSGAGGGGGSSNGGNITAYNTGQGQERYIAQPINGGTAGNPGTPGGDGMGVTQPFLISIGGAGGGAGSTTTANGGNGGNAGFGSGGGGGGAGAIGGTGGSGGPGLVIITSW